MYFLWKRNLVSALQISKYVKQQQLDVIKSHEKKFRVKIENFQKEQREDEIGRAHV